MLCEIAMARTMIDDLDALVSTALSIGKDGIEEFILPAIDDEPSEGEGI
jgi:hypothetical protein